MLNPVNLEAFSNRSFCYMKLGKPKNAIADAEECIKIDKENTEGWIRKAGGHSLQKDYPNAIDACHKALTLDPTNEEIKASLENAI